MEFGSLHEVTTSFGIVRLLCSAFDSQQVGSTIDCTSSNIKMFLIVTISALFMVLTCLRTVLSHQSTNSTHMDTGRWSNLRW
jgi:hypothetical protein